MSTNEERPYVQIPLPSPDERRMFEEWVRSREKKYDSEEKKEDQRVIVVDI